jgi:hypothetical protein
MGLADGENLERLWSYLGRFANMSRRMKPSNRLDLLSEALEYFAEKTIRNLGNIYLLCKKKNCFITNFINKFFIIGKLLVKSFKNAKILEMSSFEELQKVFVKYSINESFIQNLIKKQEEKILNPNGSNLKTNFHIFIIFK